MTIRDMTQSDFPAVFGFIEKLWDYNTYDAEEVHVIYDRILADENSFAYVALAGDTPIGFAEGTVFDTFWLNGPTCYLSGIFVEESMRGSGYGKALMDRVHDMAKERGCRGIVLDSGLPRTGAHAFYERYGFDKSCYGFELVF